MLYKGFCLVVLLTTLQSGKGEDYLVAVANKGNYAYIRSTAGETGGLVEIQYPRLTDRGTDTLGPFSGRSLPINDQVKITSDVANAAIIVSGSDEDVNIVVDAGDVFSPLPISALGTKYILPSSLPPNTAYRSLILIATHKMSTTVDIFLRMNRGSISFANHRYSDGDKLSLKLNPYQTLRVFTPYDLNGTVINSEHSVAVYSGMEYASKYTVYDQLLPVKHYGQEYVVAVDDTKLELQIISEHSHVQITFSSGTTASTGKHSLYNRSLERGESLHFTATRPVLVTLSRADGYSSSFTTVPPVHLYATYRGVWLYFRNLHIKLKVITDRRATVLIKDKKVNDLVIWMDIAGSIYKVGTLLQSQPGYIYSTSISSDLPFTVLSFIKGSVYNTGYNVSAEEPVHYAEQSHLMALAGRKSYTPQIPRILATTGETGGQWQIQDPNSGRVWSRSFNPHNTDYFYPIVHEAYRVILVLVLVSDDGVQIKGGMNRYTSFSPLPISALGKKYIMSSCLAITDRASFISVLMIATHSKKADINIIFRLDGNVIYDGITYIDGDALSVRLDKYQILSLNSSSDMTGTIVNATETIAVYSGTYNVGRTRFCTFEQLLPLKHYGHEYILAIQDPSHYHPTGGSSRQYQLQVVTNHSDMNIMFDNGSSISVGENGVYRKQCRNFETFYFTSTRTAMVTLCAIGSNSYYDGLIVVPPVSLYSQLTSLQTPAGTVHIVTDRENSNVDVQGTHDTLSTVFTRPVNWKNVSGTRFKVGTSSGHPYTTTIRSSSTFAVLGYDYYTIYNGGYSFGKHIDTETSTPDGRGIKLNTETSAPDGRGIKLTTDVSFQADSPNNAAVIVGVVCGIVIVALLVAFAAYVFYTRRKTKPVTTVAEQECDALSTSMNIYAVPDSVAESAAGEGLYTGLTFTSTPCDININDSTATFVNYEDGK